MSEKHQRNRADRRPDNPGNRAQAAALGAGDPSRQGQVRAQSAEQDGARQDTGQSGRGWDDLSNDTLNTDQTSRR